MSSTSNTAVPRERSLGEWLKLLRDGWIALVVCIALGVVGALLYTSRQESSYGATYTLVVSPVRGFLDPQNADQLPALADTVSRLATTEPVLRQTARDYALATADPAEANRRRLTATDSWLKGHISAVREANSAILQLAATAPTQIEASALARAAGRALARAVNVESAARRRVLGGLYVSDFRATSNGQTSPTPSRNVLIGVNAGILIGLLAAFLLGTARRRLWRREDVADELGVPVLGTARAHRGKTLTSGPGFGNVANRLIAGKEPGRRCTVLVTGTTSPEQVAEAARLVSEALRATGAAYELLGQDSDVVAAGEYASANGRAAREPAAGENGVHTREPSDTPPEPETERAGESSASTLTATRVRETSDRPGAGFTIMTAPPLGSDSERVDEMAADADWALVVIERGTPARRISKVHSAGLNFERRLVGAILIE